MQSKDIVIGNYYAAKRSGADKAFRVTALVTKKTSQGTKGYVEGNFDGENLVQIEVTDIIGPIETVKELHQKKLAEEEAKAKAKAEHERLVLALGDRLDDLGIKTNYFWGRPGTKDRQPRGDVAIREVASLKAVIAILDMVDAEIANIVKGEG